MSASSTNTNITSSTEIRAIVNNFDWKPIHIWQIDMFQIQGNISQGVGVQAVVWLKYSSIDFTYCCPLRPPVYFVYLILIRFFLWAPVDLYISPSISLQNHRPVCNWRGRSEKNDEDDLKKGKHFIIRRNGAKKKVHRNSKSDIDMIDRYAWLLSVRLNPYHVIWAMMGSNRLAQPTRKKQGVFSACIALSLSFSFQCSLSIPSNLSTSKLLFAQASLDRFDFRWNLSWAQIGLTGDRWSLFPCCFPTSSSGATSVTSTICNTGPSQSSQQSIERMLHIHNSMVVRVCLLLIL